MSLQFTYQIETKLQISHKQPHTNESLQKPELHVLALIPRVISSSTNPQRVWEVVAFIPEWCSM